MTTLAVLPDIEQVLVAYFRSRTEVTTLSSSIGTRTPADTTTSWVRITRIGGVPVRNRPLHADAALVQLDFYGGDNVADARGEAHALMAAARAVLAEIHEATLDDAVVTGVTFGSAPRIPDRDFEPARERYAATVTVYFHPKPS